MNPPGPLQAFFQSFLVSWRGLPFAEAMCFRKAVDFFGGKPALLATGHIFVAYSKGSWLVDKVSSTQRLQETPLM